MLYDFIVEANGHACRVQVKSCSYRRRHGGYQCIYRNFGRRLYTSKDFEFAAFYVVPENIWYIIPVAALACVTNSIALWPHRPRSKYYRFEEAWHLLQGPQELEHQKADVPVTKAG